MNQNENPPLVSEPAVSGPVLPEPMTARSMQLRSNFRHSAQGREIVRVLGMHRSGTSLLSNILHLLGVDMVDQPPHVSKKNETGFWERPDILALQDEILNALGTPVGSPLHAVPLKAGWWRNPEIRDLKRRLHDLTAEHLSRVRRPWGFKDPRTCRLLPLWGEILEELDVSPRFVWAVRHPAEAAASMSNKNPQARPIPVPQSEVMWLAYNYDILRYAGRHWPIIVPYDAWFGDAVALAKELGQELDVMWRGSDHELEMALAELISADKRHHWAQHGKLRCGLAISDEVYSNILALRANPDVAFNEQLAVSLQSLLGAVKPFAAEARELRPLKDEAARLAKETEQLQASLGDAEALAQSLRGEIIRRDEAQAEIETQSISLREALSAARSEHQASTTHLSLLGGEHDELRSKFAALSETHRQLRQDRDELLEHNHGLMARATAAEATGDQLRKSTAILQSELAVLTASHSSTRDAEAGLRTEVDKLQQALAAETALREALATDKQELVAAGEALQAEFNLNNRKLDAFRHQIAAASAAETEARAVIEKLTAQRDSLQADLQNVMTARDALRAEAEAADRDIGALKTQLNTAAITESELKKKMAGFASEIDRLRAETLGIETARDEQLHLASTLTADLRALQQQREEEARAVSEDQDMLRFELESALVARDWREEELSTAIAERDELRAELAELRQLHLEMEQRIFTADATRDELRAELTELQQSHLEMEQKLSTADAERDEIQRKMQSDSEAWLEIVDEAKSTSEHWQREHADLLSERNRLRQDLEQLQQSQAEFEQRLAATAATQAELSQQLQSETAARQSLLGEAQESHAQLRQSLVAAVQERDHVLAESEAGKHERLALEQQLAERDTLAEQLRKKLAERASAEAAAREAARTVAAEVNRLKAELAGLRATLRSERERLAEAGLQSSVEDHERRVVS